jgi:hypothetical protein
MYDDTSLAVDNIDTYVNASPPVWGLNITERLFWEAYIMIQDCSRPSGTEWDIGRGSEVRCPFDFAKCLIQNLYQLFDCA